MSRERQRSILIERVAKVIVEEMERQDVTKAELARTLGVSRAYVTQLLSGRRNMTLGTLSDVFHALGGELSLKVRFGRSIDASRSVAQPDS